MSAKLATVFMALCLVYLLEIEGSFIKTKTVPRVGRSNEADPFDNEDDGLMGYVIKTNKNIPRMGRRNYDSENRFEIPKFYQSPMENNEYAADDDTLAQKEDYYKQLHNMK